MRCPTARPPAVRGCAAHSSLLPPPVRRVPPNAPLYYEVSLLRCQTFNLGLACCADADFPCIKKPEAELTMTSMAPKQ